jgi:transcriptional regulator with XRE-family HTH domain
MPKRKQGKALLEYMEGRGMKRRRELARALEMSDAMLSQYFAGKKSFSARTALRISHQTGIPMEELFR